MERWPTVRAGFVIAIIFSVPMSLVMYYYGADLGMRKGWGSIFSFETLIFTIIAWIYAWGVCPYSETIRKAMLTLYESVLFGIVFFMSSILLLMVVQSLFVGRWLYIRQSFEGVGIGVMMVGIMLFFGAYLSVIHELVKIWWHRLIWFISTWAFASFWAVKAYF